MRSRCAEEPRLEGFASSRPRLVSQEYVKLAQQRERIVLTDDRVHPRLHMRQEEPVERDPAAEARLAETAAARDAVLSALVEAFAGEHEVQALDELEVRLEKPHVSAF